jgi:hypothetical protein
MRPTYFCRMSAGTSSYVPAIANSANISSVMSAAMPPQSPFEAFSPSRADTSPQPCVSSTTRYAGVDA